MGNILRQIKPLLQWKWHFSLHHLHLHLIHTLTPTGKTLLVGYNNIKFPVLHSEAHFAWAEGIASLYSLIIPPPEVVVYSWEWWGTRQQSWTTAPDPTDTPLTSPDFAVFIGGSASRDPGTGKNTVGFFWRRCWGFWVVSSDDLITFIDACKHAPDNTVSVYTDSRYILGLFMITGATIETKL